jgi:sulfotransferase
MAVEKIFFQSSLPRSGSTILQNILAQNNDIYATPTSGVLELIFAARQNYTDSAEFKAQDSDLMRIAFLNYCNKGIFGFYDAITSRKYVVDKSRGWGIHYDFLNSVLKDKPKIICMVRDLRDVFASMENNFRKHPDKAKSIVNWAEMRGTSVPKRIDVWSQSPPIGLAIERLQEMIRLGIDKRILFVKYEDLCLNPVTEMIRIYEYLGIDYFHHDFDAIVQFTKEDDTVYGAFGDHTIRHELKLLPSKAKQLLGKEVCDWIYNNYKWFNDYFKYSK